MALIVQMTFLTWAEHLKRGKMESQLRSQLSVCSPDPTSVFLLLFLTNVKQAAFVAVHYVFLML